uniref:Uncharacterized protein n=1 Tax=Vespula pensylvanica TaxID=30213 RepID=A0A834P505_VESPE|nr:hypothetical protein H0235_005567 [Vespula pensylvanica]
MYLGEFKWLASSGFDLFLKYECKSLVSLVAWETSCLNMTCISIAGASAESTQERKDSSFYINERSRSASRSSRSILPSSSSMSSSSMSILSSSERTLQRIFKTTPWSNVDSTQTFGLAHGSSRMMSEENSEKTQTTIRNYLSNESNSFSSLRNRLEYPVIEPSENFDVSRISTKGTSKISRNIPISSTITEIIPTTETRGISTEIFSKTTSTSMLLSSSRDDIFRRRQMRHAADKCEKFLLGDEAKREFYSPNYPNPYPNHTECVRVLEDYGPYVRYRDKFFESSCSRRKKEKFCSRLGENSTMAAIANARGDYGVLRTACKLRQVIIAVAEAKAEAETEA